MRAGLEPWIKPFQNLRSTRETELVEQFPVHVVCYWLGNSEKVAKAHYLQVTDEHFQRATRQGGAPAGARKELQRGAESTQRDAKPLKNVHGRALPCTSVVREGLEPPTKGL